LTFVSAPSFCFDQSDVESILKSHDTIDLRIVTKKLKGKEVVVGQMKSYKLTVLILKNQAE
jgi:hypothetical protein